MTDQGPSSALRRATLDDLASAARRLSTRRARRRRRGELVLATLASLLVLGGVGSAATGHGLLGVFRDAGGTLRLWDDGGAHEGFPATLHCSQPDPASCTTSGDGSAYRLIGVIDVPAGMPVGAGLLGGDQTGESLPAGWQQALQCVDARAGLRCVAPGAALPDRARRVALYLAGEG